MVRFESPPSRSEVDQAIKFRSGLPDLRGKSVMCPGSGEELQVSMKTLRVVQKHGQAVYFCCNGCLTGFWAAPEKYLEMSAENTIIL